MTDFPTHSSLRVVEALRKFSGCQPSNSTLSVTTKAPGYQRISYRNDFFTLETLLITEVARSMMDIDLIMTFHPVAFLY